MLSKGCFHSIDQYEDTDFPKAGGARRGRGDGDKQE